MNNEYTRKEKPCFLSNGEFCDKEDKNCDRCIDMNKMDMNALNKDGEIIQ